MSLKKLLKHPGTWLVLFSIPPLLALADSFRAPENQVTGRLYVSAVRCYQSLRGDKLERYVLCRFEPTCSEYSIQAVQKHGFRHGLVLTVKRLMRCQKDVRAGTRDPVH